MYTVDYFIRSLNLVPHVEGGYYREVYRSRASFKRQDGTAGEVERSVATTIYFLLPGSAVSRFHRLKSDEIWFFHYGSPLIIHTIDAQGIYAPRVLGLSVDEGTEPQITIPATTLFGAEPTDNSSFSLVSCMVAPGFDFADFEMFETKELFEICPEQRELFARFEHGTT